MLGVDKKESYDVDLENYRRETMDPRFWLKVVIVVLTVALAVLIGIWGSRLYAFSNPDTYNNVDAKAWVTIVGVYLAAVGWLTSAIVTVRNSVKQHTITTLLQTRLSATYMERAKKALDFYSNGNYSPRSPAPSQAIKAASEKFEIEYVLNYLEFLAVGVRCADLHEDVLKKSMRGIVVRFTKTSEHYIADLRQQHGPATYDNLVWLYVRWHNQVHDGFEL